nr:hypothetical protein [Corallococcus coralloides]
MDFRVYAVKRADREPLLRFMLDALEGAGCRILAHTPPTQAPFCISFETSTGERMGIVAYAFFANSQVIRNRPPDEHRFQIKYGSDFKSLHPIWQDPYMLYTTLFCGIDPERGHFVGADPVLHNPTPFSRSIEYKEHHSQAILRHGWYCWEREFNGAPETPVEVLVGGTANHFLRYVRFEREALGEDQGHRQLLAERAATPLPPSGLMSAADGPWAPAPPAARLHALAEEFQLDAHEVLDLIANARRLKMAVRGWVAEEHLVRALRQVPGVTDCVRDDGEGQPDVSLRFEGSRPLRIECKNVLRIMAAGNVARVDFQRTRAAKDDPCSRYYSPDDFDVVAACLHAVTLQWEFRFAPTAALEGHPKCPGKLASNVRVDQRWQYDVQSVLRAVA